MTIGMRIGSGMAVLALAGCGAAGTTRSGAPASNGTQTGASTLTAGAGTEQQLNTIDNQLNSVDGQMRSAASGLNTSEGDPSQ